MRRYGARSGRGRRRVQHRPARAVLRTACWRVVEESRAVCVQHRERGRAILASWTDYPGTEGRHSERGSKVRLREIGIRLDPARFRRNETTVPLMSGRTTHERQE